jgi:hypothetical protein
VSDRLASQAYESRGNPCAGPPNPLLTIS